MISNLSLAIFACALLIILIFMGWSLKNERRRPLLHKLYLALMLAYVSWVIPLMCMRLVAPSNTGMMFFLDCMTAPGGSLCSPIYLCIAVAFVEGYERMQKWMKWMFLLPFISILVTWTNPLHHLQYVKFSVVRSEIIFGPYVLVSGAVNYCILIGAVFYMIRFVVKNSRIEADQFRELMLQSGDMSNDVGSIVYGEQAVELGLMDRVGTLHDALASLYEMMDEQKKR